MGRASASSMDSVCSRRKCLAIARGRATPKQIMEDGGPTQNEIHMGRASTTITCHTNVACQSQQALWTVSAVPVNATPLPDVAQLQRQIMDGDVPTQKEVPQGQSFSKLYGQCVRPWQI